MILPTFAYDGQRSQYGIRKTFLRPRIFGYHTYIQQKKKTKETPFRTDSRVK